MRRISIVGADDEPVKRRMSRRSVVGVMDKFVQAVDNMNETVMIPSLLMDLSPDEQQNNNSTDLHAFYSLLNSIRQKLLYGSGNSNAEFNNVSFTVSSNLSTRRLSTASIYSSDTDYSSGSFASESEFSSLESEDGSNYSRITRDFQHHLLGLCQSLKHLTQSADVLTKKYKVEVENSTS